MRRFRGANMPGVYRMIVRSTVVCVLCLAVGGPLILQPLAWGSMIIQYSHQMTLHDAVAQTFDGDHPCDLCKSIAAAHQSKNQQEARLAPVRPDLFCANRIITLRSDWIDLIFFEPQVRAIARNDSPPTPPPRPGLA